MPWLSSHFQGTEFWIDLSTGQILILNFWIKLSLKFLSLNFRIEYELKLTGVRIFYCFCVKLSVLVGWWERKGWWEWEVIASYESHKGENSAMPFLNLSFSSFFSSYFYCLYFLFLMIAVQSFPFDHGYVLMHLCRFSWLEEINLSKQWPIFVICYNSMLSLVPLLMLSHQYQQPMIGLWHSVCFQPSPLFLSVYLSAAFVVLI